MMGAGLLAVTMVLLLAGTPVLAQGQTVGLFLNADDSFAGYTLLSPMPSTITYLMDNEGKVVHSWNTAFQPGLMAYLLENGNLLRGAQLPIVDPRFMAGGGRAGRVEQYTWDGTLVWEFEYSTEQHLLHHDLAALPNGNVLMIAWEYKTAAQSLGAGASSSALWPDHVIEVEPAFPAGGQIVWEWHVWDHLIQDHDPTKDNFGVVSDHPELIDINFRSGPAQADFVHTNGIAYNPALDQILLTIHAYSEIWVIDHSTTTAEAAGHTGGNSGKGGDLLYRWGNPLAYRAGDGDDRQLYRPHDATWIYPGYPGEGNILIFNNGTTRPVEEYSSVDEIEPPVDANGNYALTPGAAYGPGAPSWSYAADPTTDLFARRISGAQRLPNGNTIICDGPAGILFEVKPATAVVWRYVNPVTGQGPTAQGDPIGDNNVFKVRRYAPDYPGLTGRDLTPGDPIEQFDAPLPVPDGSGATVPLTASRVSVAGDQIQVSWDAFSCAADEYDLIYGNLGDVSTTTLGGADCAMGVSGSYLWDPVPPGDLFFLIVGVDGTGVYESSWGVDGTGAERNGTAPSNRCGVTTKIFSETCSQQGIGN